MQARPMATPETMAKVIRIAVEQFGVRESEVTPQASFVEDLGADSLDVAEFIMALEEEFDVEIIDEKAETITTIERAAEVVQELLNEKA